MSSGISRDEWIAALNEAQPVNDPAALTVTELAELIGISKPAARLRIAALVKAKRAIPTTKRVYRSIVPAYRLVSTPKAGKRAA